MSPESLALALLGGSLIGASAALLMYLNGRIAGICGILAAAVLPGKGARAWRWLFIAGLPLGVVLWHAVSGLPAPVPASGSPWLVLAAGFIVGVGTRLGSGCTSGHGVCGLARLSPRSLVATLVFMSAGAVTVAVMRHWAGG
jgi:uncharacterized membrane protein YedE/YeeE